MTTINDTAFSVHIDLVKACTDGDLNAFMSLSYNNQETFRKLIQGDLTHPYKSKYGAYMPGDYLYIACSHGHAEIVSQLLKNGAEENKPYNKVTPMMVSCQNGFAEVIRVLVFEGINSFPKDIDFKDSPLFYCCKYGNKDSIEVIVKRFPKILQENIRGDIGKCPNTEYIDAWAEFSGIVKKEEGIPTGHILLYMACILQHIEIMKFLVNKGVDVNITLSSKTFYTTLERPLSAVCQNRNYDMARFLIENKAEITKSVANQFPEMIGDLLKVHVKEYSRTYSVSVAVLKDQKELLAGVSLYWDTLCLHMLHRHWIEVYNDRVCKIDIHENQISELPIDFFELLPNLEDLDIAGNILTRLPSHELENSRVTRIIACHNKITELPLALFLNKNIILLDFSQNRIKYLPTFVKNAEQSTGTVNPTELFWECSSLKLLKCSKNLIAELPREIHGASNLEKLQLDDNNLTEFDIVWKCPLIELDVSHNQLLQFSGMTQIVWSKSLLRLNLSYNNIKTVSSNICHLQYLEYLNLSHNSLRTLPPPSNWKCKKLCKLDLSFNELTATTTVTENVVGADVNQSTQAFVNTCEFPVELFKYTLQTLDLSDNKLETVPESICFLSGLNELYLCRNPQLRSLPPTLGSLKNIWNLRLAGLHLTDMPFELDETNHAKKVLPYLRERLRKAVPFNRIKLMVVGLQGRGKTTLVAAVQGKNQLPANISTVGITIEQFALPLRSFRISGIFGNQNAAKTEIVFSTWDLAGQQVYYATHQCFLTSQTLYLVVFNTTHGNEGIDSLAPWLLNIQARAPNSRCIVVGTHTDCLPNDTKRTFLEKTEKDIRNKYDKKGYPIISGYIFVSSTTGENMETLRAKIHGVAEHMNDMCSSGESRGKMAPKSYRQLNDSVISESARRKEKNVPPILTTNDMLRLAQQNPDNDIFDEEELVQATKFLHENGIVLHFDDHLRELNTLFFIDPSWLCDMLALVVTVRERNPYIRNGYIGKTELMLVLRNPRLPENFIPQYLRLLERFEIVLCLDDENFLIPSMLPQERPDLQTILEPLFNHSDSNVTSVNNNGSSSNGIGSQYLSRNYHMTYVPAGFWSRLIARLMIAVYKWGVEIAEEGGEDISTESYSSFLWREGIMVTYNEGFFLVESFNDDFPENVDWSNKGVAITVWSREYDFSVMGFIVDHLDMLITEWYPGLEDVDEYGINIVQKLIPCPICSLHRQRSLCDDMDFSENFGSCFRDPNAVHQFLLLTCALAATNYRAIGCPNHLGDHVSLDLVVPDLTLTDLPRHFVIDSKQFVFEPSDKTRLGEGGAGGVYLGYYKDRKVAVKQFHSSTKTKHFGATTNPDEQELGGKDEEDGNNNYVFIPTEQSVQEQIEDGKVIRAFWELRQEVAVLCRLQHPNVIQFLGVCHSPLCFVIELAPMGSLQGIIEKLQIERDNVYNNDDSNGRMENTDVVGTILGRMISYKITLQVIEAISYLHDCEIVYRDLKSDNVLVWSLDVGDKVNVKISDYGIAAFATPQGVVGEGGTPGFQAPEIKYGSPYDEKVDLFSYGIWLYEMMSGYRPFRDYRTASEMKKAIVRGVRPNLRKDCINTQLPYIEIIMENCWQRSPISRPASDEVCMALSHPGVCMLESLFPKPDEYNLQKVTCAVPFQQNKDSNEEEKSKLLVWCDHGIDRKFQVFDFKREMFSMSSLVPGPRILCACPVESNVWLGNETQQVEVFGQLEYRKLQVLWKFTLQDHVLNMLTFQHENTLTVFASLANGTLSVFNKDLAAANDKKPIFNETAEDLISFEKDHWAVTTIHLNTKGLPAKCMTLTRNQTELWVGSGNMIVIVDPRTFAIIDHITASKKANRQALAITSDGVKYVWNCERSMSFIVQWDVETRSKMCEYQCHIERPLDQNLYGEVGSLLRNSVSSTSLDHSVGKDNVFTENSTESKVSDPETPLGSSFDENYFRDFRDRTKSIKKEDKQKVLSKITRTKSAATEIRTKLPPENASDIELVKAKERSKSDESIHAVLGQSPNKGFPTQLPSVKELEPENIISGEQGFVQRTIRNKRPSLMFPSTSRNKSKRVDYIPKELLNNSVLRPRSSVVIGTPIRVTSIKYIKGALWVGRTSGDILVINVATDSDSETVASQPNEILCGKVLTVLGDDRIRPLGGFNRTVNNLVQYQDKLLALVRFDIKPPNKSPKVVPRQSTSKIPEYFQMLRFNTWTPNEIRNFKENAATNQGML